MVKVKIMIRKAVIPAAGLGTRLLPYTKEIPKEMLPIFDTQNKHVLVKPLIHKIFENLYSVGIREFCFIVGRGKRVIEDYFTPDPSFIDLLKSKKKIHEAETLMDLYNKLQDSLIVFINQPIPMGFGHAVLLSSRFINNEPFIVHAGDTIIYSKGREEDIIKRLIHQFERHNPDIIFIAKWVKDPRAYGAIIGEDIDDELILVKNAIEKPDKPISNWAIMPIYIFKPRIFDALKKTKPGKRGEIELTDGIVKVIEEGGEVLALKMSKNDVWIDFGMVETYRDAIQISIRDSFGVEK